MFGINIFGTTEYANVQSVSVEHNIDPYCPLPLQPYSPVDSGTTSIAPFERNDDIITGIASPYTSLPDDC